MRRSTASNVIWAGRQICMKNHAAHKSSAHMCPGDHGYMLFALFGSTCVVGKDPNTPKWSSMADDAIMWGIRRYKRSGISPLQCISVVAAHQATGYYSSSGSLKEVKNGKLHTLPAGLLFNMEGIIVPQDASFPCVLLFSLKIISLCMKSIHLLWST